MCQDPSTWILHARLPPRGPNAGRGWASRGLFKAEAPEKVKVGRVVGSALGGSRVGKGWKEHALKNGKPGVMGSDHCLRREFGYSLGMEEVESE